MYQYLAFQIKFLFVLSSPKGEANLLGRVEDGVYHVGPIGDVCDGLVVTPTQVRGGF